LGIIDSYKTTVGVAYLSIKKRRSARREVVTTLCHISTAGTIAVTHSPALLGE